MTAKAPFRYSLNADHSVVTLELDAKTIELTAEQLQITLLWLGHVRFEMSPAVASDPTPSEPILPIADWRVEPSPLGRIPAQVGGRIMLRSLNFGWFAIPLSAEGFQDLAGGVLGAPIAKPPDTTVQ